MNEADVLGVDPKGLGSLTIKAKRFKWAEGARQDSSYQFGVPSAQRVDKESYKKHGISVTTS